MSSDIISFVRNHLFTLPVLAKFALGMAMIVAIPRLSRRLHIPAAVGLLVGGVIIGPYVLGFFGTDRPIADFMAELGKLLLMFFAGAEIDLALFRRARNRSIAFGITTTVLPLLLGTFVGIAFGYAAIPAIVIGSLLASHTLLGVTAVDRLGLGSLEPVTVAVGATVMSDTLSLVVFAICVSIYTTGFSPPGLALLLAEIVGYILLVLFGLSRLGAYMLKRVEDEEDAYFVLMLCIMAIAGLFAAAIQLPGIVGAFLAGLAVNASAHDKPASAKLAFLGKSLFIPIFFIVTGFLIDPVTFIQGIVDNFWLVAGIIGALLVGKWIAAWAVGHVFGYSQDERLTIWSLTLPQAAATLAATLVAHETLDAAGHRLLDDRMLNTVLVLVFVTSILGPILTEQFAPRLAIGHDHSEQKRPTGCGFPALPGLRARPIRRRLKDCWVEAMALSREREFYCSVGVRNHGANRAVKIRHRMPGLR
jgi:Kef-type K+ transport system membrane component KefB